MVAKMARRRKWSTKHESPGLILWWGCPWFLGVFGVGCTGVGPTLMVCGVLMLSVGEGACLPAVWEWVCWWLWAPGLWGCVWKCGGGLLVCGCAVLSDGEGRNYSSSSPPALPQSTHFSHPFTPTPILLCKHPLTQTANILPSYSTTFLWFWLEKGSFQNQGHVCIPAGCHNLLQPCSRAARKWGENEEMEREGKWL